MISYEMIKDILIRPLLFATEKVVEYCFVEEKKEEPKQQEEQKEEEDLPEKQSTPSGYKEN